MGDGREEEEEEEQGSVFIQPLLLRVAAY